MEDISKRAFENLGLSKEKAFLLSSRLKYGAYTITCQSEKHSISAENNAWIDRVCNHISRLQVAGEKGIHASHEDLSSMTGHSKLLEEMENDTLKIKNLMETAKAERKEGFLTCRNCKGTKVDVDQMQTRSADEPMTLFAICTECGTRWTMK